MPTKGNCKKCGKIIFNIKNRSGYCIKCSPLIGRYKRDKIHRIKMSKILSGGNNPMFGKIPWNKGIPRTQEVKNKISKANKGRLSLSNNPAWQGGKSFEPYALEWTEELKKQIKKRDNYTCQKCRTIKKELHIHHIDLNKLNCKENNLISLCAKCHTIIHRNVPPKCAFISATSAI